MSELKNKWIIRYKENQFSYKDILEYLPVLRNKDFISNDIIKIYIVFDKSFGSNHYYLEKIKNEKVIFFKISNLESKIEKTEDKIRINNKFKKIKTDSINLLYPILISDKRWDSIELPTSSIYLGSALKNNRFKVEINKLKLPNKNFIENYSDFDVTGISIYEDLFTEISTFLNDFAKSYSGLIVGGGPMITLSPIETTYHLNDINLLIRGEAEMIFPKILMLLSKGELEQILNFKGIILNIQSLIILSDIDYINRPEVFKDFDFNLDFAKNHQLERGLEINISRGCERNCIFCSKVQGKKYRKIEPEKFENLLISMAKRVENSFYSDESKTLNINDDDILQDKYYAKEIFKIISKHNFKIWGIQTSIQSFFNNSEIDDELISILNDKNLFVAGKPLIWLGTDAFLKKRRKKLTKFIPDINNLKKLISKFEAQKIINFHYWISSDPDSTWDEFIDELIIIDNLRINFKYFDVLAHAPFLIPYSSTPLNLKLNGSDEYSDQIIYKKILKSKNSNYNFSFIEKVITKYKYLNKLLSNEKIVGNKGFFDYIKDKNRFNLFLTLYNFLKKERLESETYNSGKLSNILKTEEKKIENILSDLS